MYKRVDYLESRPSCVGRNVQKGLLSFCRLLTGGLLLVLLTMQTAAAQTITWNGTAVNYNANTTVVQNVNVTAATTVTVAAGVTVTISGVISGSAAITKAGAGMLVFTGTNSHRGQVTISAGTIEVGFGGNTGTISDDVIVNAGGKLVFDRSNSYTWAGSLRGSGNVEVWGNLYLTGNSANFTGTTTVADGNLNIGNGGTVGNLSSTINVSYNGVLIFNRSNAYTHASVIAGDGGLYQSGTGTTVLTAANSFTGYVVVNGGTLQIGNGSTGSIANTAIEGISVMAACTLRVQPPSAGMTISRVIAGTGRIEKTGGYALYLTGNNVFTGTTTVAGGWLNIGNGDTTGSLAGSITVDSGAYLTFNRSNLYTHTGVISGAGGVTQQGTGTTVLTANGNYTGITTVNYGTLQVGNGTSGWIGTSATDSVRLTNANAVLRLQPGVSGSFYPKITGVGSVQCAVKSGEYLQFAVEHTYTGSTTIDSGELRVTRNMATSNVVLVRTSSVLRFVPYGNIIFSPSITGAGKVEYRGNSSNQLILTAANSYTGGTTVDTGWLVIGNNGTTGSITGNIVLTNSLSEVHFYRSDTVVFPGIISGQGSVEQSAPNGKTILTGVNSYTGRTYVYAGTLQVGNGTSGSIQNTDSVRLESVNSILRFEPGATVTFSKKITGWGSVQCAVKSGLTLYFTANNTYTGTTTIDSGSLYLGSGGTAGSVAGNIINNGTLWFSRSDTVTYSGVISGTGRVSMSYQGKVILTGVNTYTGNTILNSGCTLQVGNGTSGSINNTANVQINNVNGILRFEPGTFTYFDKRILGSGSVEYSGSASKPLYFTYSNTYTGTTTIDSGFLYLGDQGTTGGIAGDIIVKKGGQIIFNRSNDYTYAGDISGAGSVKQYGTMSGKTILTGTNTYTGTTYIDTWATLQVGNGTSGSIQNTDSVVILYGILRFEPGTNTIFDRKITGQGSVQYKGSAAKKLLFGNEMTYTGSTTVELGTLQIGESYNPNTGTIYFGTIYSTSGVYLADTQAILRFGLDWTWDFIDKVISGTGKVEIASENIVFTADNTYTGKTTIEQGGFLSLGYHTPTGKIAGDVEVQAGGELAFNLSTDYTYSKAISGSGDVTNSMPDSSRLILNGNNTCTGTLYNWGGILEFSDWKGGVQISSPNATLDVKGNVSVGGFLDLRKGTLNFDLSTNPPSKITAAGKYDMPPNPTDSVILNITALGAGKSFTLITVDSGMRTDRLVLAGAGANGTLTATKTELIFNTCISGTTGGLAWELCDSTLSITGTGAMPDYTVGTAPWYPYQNRIKTLVLDNGITYIGNNAFYGCDSLRGSLTLPNSLISTGIYAFAFCRGFTGSLVIPNSVTTIGYTTFNGCNGFTGLTIGNSVQTIGDYAFYNCYGFTGNLTIPNSVTTIGERAFWGCHFTGDLTIPNSVTTIGDYAFEACQLFTGNLTIGNSVTTIGTNAFQNCNGFTGNLTIGNSVKTIGQNAFQNCRRFTSLTLGGAVDTIKSAAFSGDTALASIVSDAVTPPWLEDASVFNNVKRTIPVSVPCGSKAAYRSAFLWSTFPDSVYHELAYFVRGTTGDLEWTLYCDSTLSITGTGAMEDYEEFYDGSKYISTAPWYPYKDRIKTLVLNNNITHIGDYAFYYCDSLRGSLSLPSSLISIGNSAFAGCGGFTGNLVIPNSVTTIGDYAFAACYGFTGNLVIPNSVTTIGNSAFGSCFGFTGNLIISNSVTSIGDDAFAGCDGFTGSLVIGNSVQTIGENAFENCNGFTGNLEIPNSVTTIGSAAFKNCNGFTGNLTIGNSVKTIKNQAFRYCYGFTGLTLGNSITTIGEYAFDFCSGFTGNLTIPNSVTTIEGYAFGACYGLTSLTLGNSVDTIGYSAFEGDTALAAIASYAVNPPWLDANVFQNVKTAIPVSVPCGSIGTYKAVPQWNSFPTYQELSFAASGTTGGFEWVLYCDSTFTITGTGAMPDYTYSGGGNPAPWYPYRTKIKKIVLDNNITHIGNFAFSGCQSLTDSLVLPASLTSIGNSAFGSCYNITGGLHIPNTVVYIGDNAFGGCGFTGSLIFPDSLAYLGTGAFSGCDAFTGDLVIPNLITFIGGASFEWCHGFTSLTVGDAVKSIGYGAFFDCYGLTSLSLGSGLDSISEYAFESCYAIADITSYAVNPPKLGTGNIDFPYTVPVTVPCGSVGAYQAAAQWSNFTNYQTLSFVASGTTGSLSWVLDCDSVFTITGSGAMEDYEYGTAPWFSYRDRIKTLVLNNGITHIGNYAFYNCQNLTDSLVLPASLISIGDWAFGDCYGFTGSLTIGNSVTSIGEGAFASCSGFTGNLVIPNSVQTIEYGAFAGCDGFTGSLTIGNSVTTIGDEAFRDCSGFTGNLSIPNSVTSIGEGAFYRCNGFTGNLIIPNSVKTIGDVAFMECSGFNGNLTIGNSVQTIGTYTFMYCYGFTGSLTIGNSVQTIEDVAFYGCRGFTSLTLGSAVTSIGYSAFEGDTALASITSYAVNPPVVVSDAFYDVKTTIPVTVPCGSVGAYEAAPQWSGFTNYQTLSYIASGTTGSLSWVLDCDSVFTITGSGAMADYEYGTAPWYPYRTKIKKIVLDNNITHIGNYAFVLCENLTDSLSLPSSLISIGDWAFEACSGFTGNLEIPNSVKTIGSYAFRDCSGFTGNLIIPNSVTTIGFSAFEGCNGFTGNLTIGNSVQTIGNHAFDGCYGFTGSLTIGNSVQTIGDAAFDACYGFTGNLVIPNSVTSIGNEAFMYCSGFNGNLTIGNSVKTIGFSAFEGCNGFTGNLTIGNSVTSIGEGAFSECSGFTGNLIIPNSVTTIEYGAFAGCSGFTGSLTIGNSVTTIGDFAFGGDTSLASITSYAVNPPVVVSYTFYDVKTTIPVTVPCGSVGAYENAAVWDNFQNYQALSYIASGTTGSLSWVLGCDSILTITGTGAMADYTDGTAPWYPYQDRIKTLVLNNGITHIGEWAFFYCYNLTGNLTIPNSVTTIGNGAFMWCSGFTGNLIIPNSVQTIGGGAFGSCSGFTGDLVIPNAVTTIGGGAFGNCSGFTGTLTLGNSVTTIRDGAFDGCYGFTGNLVIPNSVTYIGGNAFNGCSGFTGSLTLGNSVQTIDDGEYGAFEGCSGFTGNLVIPNSVTTIGGVAFNRCYGFTGLILGSAVNSIGYSAFGGDTALTAITSYAVNPPVAGDSAFAYVKPNIPVTVPCGSVGAYESAAEWEDFTNYIVRTDTSSYAASICSGDSYNFFGTMLSSAGTYFDTLQNVNGCDSVIELTLTVYPSVAVTYDTVTICSGGTYNFLGKVLSVAGTYYDTLPNVNGCDSIITLTLSVGAGYFTPLAASICPGESYNFAGKNLYVAGKYYDTLHAALGCDSVIELTLTVYPSVAVTYDTVSICSGGTYNFLGKVLSVAGTYYDTLPNVNGCDSVIQLAFGVYPSVAVTYDTVNICSGETYNFFGKVLSVAGTYYDTLPNINGCDSVIQLAFGVYPSVAVTYDTVNICSGGTYNFLGKVLSVAGTYYDTLYNITGCDSVIQLAFGVYPSVAVTYDTVNVCSGETYNFLGTVLSVAGTYYDTLYNITGCDSVIQLAFGVYPSVAVTYDTVNICAGETYNFFGKVLSVAGTYYDTLYNITGCDSVIQLAFGVYPSVAVTFDTVNICSGGTYNFFGKVLSVAGTYYDTLYNITGCDSVIQLAFGVYPSVAVTFDTVNICSGETYNFLGKVLSVAGTYFDTLPNVNGCDSVIQLAFGVYPSVAVTFDTVNICSGETYNFFGKVLSVAGTYYDTLPNINGCDSVIQLAFGVYPSVAVTYDTVNICSGETYNFAGKVLSVAGTYYDTLYNITGCDSVIQLAFGVYPSVAVTFDTVNVCSGETYNFFGKVLSVAGTYYDTLPNVNGCDSVIQLAFGVYPSVAVTFDTVNICFGETYNFLGKVLSVAGTYYDTLPNVNGCDSVIQLEFGVYPSVAVTYDTVNVCSGETYNFFGKVLSVAGTYYDTLPNVNGCDSVIQLAFGVYPSVAVTSYSVNICQGDVYNDANFSNLTLADTYYDTLQNVNGCDSVIELELIVNAVYFVQFDDTICDGDVYSQNGFNETTAGIYTQNLQSVHGCDSTVELTLTVNPTYLTPLTATIYDCESYDFYGQTLTASGTYYQTFPTINGCDSTFELVLTVNPFIAVVSIEDLPATAKVNEPLELSGTVNPSNAVNQTIEWNLVNAGTTNASVYGNTFFASAEGTAFVAATIKDGKSIGEDYTQSFTIIVSNVGIANYELGMTNYVVYPNPTTGKLTIKFSVVSSQLSVELFDVVGQCVGTYSIRPEDTETTIDISHLASGLYFLKIEGKMVKVVKQ